MALQLRVEVAFEKLLAWRAVRRTRVYTCLGVAHACVHLELRRTLRYGVHGRGKIEGCDTSGNPVRSGNHWKSVGKISWKSRKSG